MSASLDPRETLLRWLAGKPRDALRRAVREEADARPLAEAALEQGVLALMHEEAVAEGGWPAPVVAWMADRHRVLLARGIAQLAFAGRLQRRLVASGRRTLPLKGAALAESHYASPAQRVMSDVDLLVLDDLAGAVADLEAQGLRILERADHAASLLDGEQGHVVELHRSVTSCPGFFPLDADALWSRARDAAGLVGRRPAPEDLFVQVALHAAFQHAFVLSLGQWLDLRRLVEGGLGEEMVEIARAARAEGAVRAALLAASAVVAVPEGEALAGRLRATPGLDRWLDRRRGEPLLLVVPTPAPTAAARWHIAAGRRVELVRRTLLSGPAGVTASPMRRATAAASRALRLGRGLIAR